MLNCIPKQKHDTNSSELGTMRKASHHYCNARHNSAMLRACLNFPQDWACTAHSAQPALFCLVCVAANSYKRENADHRD